MTENPYAAPQTDAGSAAPDGQPAPKSFARRLSFALAPVGVIAFWIPVVRLGVLETGEQLAGVGLLLALTVHLVGFATVFAAPRGRRLAPALLHVGALVLVAAAIILGAAVEATEGRTT